MSRLASKIEAILYLKAQPLKIAQIAEFAQCDRDTAEEGLIELMGEYAHREGALEIAETEDGYALQLRDLFKPLVDTIVPLDIGLGALRTLAAIALRGPIAQSELVEVRGSGIYQHVPDLVEQGFVKKRRQADGRSSWLQVTEKFYQHFEIDKLPQIESLRLPQQKKIPLDSPADVETEVGTESPSEESAVAVETDLSAEAELTDVDTTESATRPEIETGEPDREKIAENESLVREKNSEKIIEGIASDEVIDQVIAEKEPSSDTATVNLVTEEKNVVDTSEP